MIIFMQIILSLRLRNCKRRRNVRILSIRQMSGNAFLYKNVYFIAHMHFGRRAKRAF